MNYNPGLESVLQAFAEQVELFVKRYESDFIKNTTVDDGPQNVKWYKTIDFRMTLTDVKFCPRDEYIKGFIAGLEYYWEQFILEFMWNKYKKR